jgi:hypothetical protein
VQYPQRRLAQHHAAGQAFTMEIYSAKCSTTASQQLSSPQIIGQSRCW